ncbi:MAG: TolC family protein [candidate division WOR-3 bacterium]|nr:MAG: TolC family protein [candidate division WOR-3 bacterium]
MRRFIRLSSALLVAAGALEPLSAGTLTLDIDQAVELALRNNHAIAQAEARVDAASAGKGAAFGSFLPQLSASGSYYRMGTVNQFEMVTPIPGKFPLRVYDPETGEIIGFTDSIVMTVGVDTMELELGSADNFTIRGTAEWVLFTWGKLVNAYRIAGLSLDMEKEGLRLARIQVRTQAVEGFYQAMLARRMAELMKDSYAQLERHVDQVKTLYEEGLAKRLDYARANVGLVNMESQVSALQNAAALAEAALRNTLDLEPGTALELTGDLEFEDWDIGLEDAVESALENRPELLQLRDATRMADLGVRIARTANLPSLFAQFNYDYKNPVGFSPGWGTDWNLLVGAQMPLFTGGTNWNKLKQAKAQQRQAKVGLAMAEDGIRLEVEALHNTLTQEHSNIDYQSQNVSLAEDALEMAETGYQNGLVTNLEYLDTQLALTQSRVSYLSSLANHRIAGARLRQAMGIAEQE